MKTIETYITFEHKSNRILANRVLKAMSQLCGYSNGTIRNPTELASSEIVKYENGEQTKKSLIETIYEEGEVIYNDGWYIVEVQNFADENESIILVSLTAQAEKEYDEVEYISNIELDD